MRERERVGLGVLDRAEERVEQLRGKDTHTVTCYSQNYSAILEKITVANGYGAAPNSEVTANGRCGLQRTWLDRAELPGPAPEVQN